MNDLISRQAAIDALDVLCQEHRYKIPGKRETYSQYNEAWQDALDRAEGAIFNLPTVQPDHTADVSKKAEGDCISRQAVVDVLRGYFDGMLETDTWSPCDVYGLIEILPSVQSEPTQEIQDILDYLDTVLHPIVSPEHWDVYSKLHDMVSGLPSAQLDGIPLEWIDKHLEWLDNCDNDFAQLAKVSIKAMVELWKKDRI